MDYDRDCTRLVKAPKEKKLMNIYTVYHSNPKLHLLSNC